MLRVITLFLVLLPHLTLTGPTANSNNITTTTTIPNLPPTTTTNISTTTITLPYLLVTTTTLPRHYYTSRPPTTTTTLPPISTTTSEYHEDTVSKILTFLLPDKDTSVGIKVVIKVDELQEDSSGTGQEEEEDDIVGESGTLSITVIHPWVEKKRWIMEVVSVLEEGGDNDTTINEDNKMFCFDKNKSNNTQEEDDKDTTRIVTVNVESNMVNEMFVDVAVELFEEEECKAVGGRCQWSTGANMTWAFAIAGICGLVFTMALNCFYYNGET